TVVQVFSLTAVTYLSCLYSFMLWRPLSYTLFPYTTLFRSEVVGEDAARKLLEEISSGAFLDRHMGDMIVPYLALAAGVSDVSLSQITMHTFTDVKVAERVAGVRFDPLPEVGSPGRLRVTGLGLSCEEVSVSPRE